LLSKIITFISKTKNYPCAAAAKCAIMTYGGGVEMKSKPKYIPLSKQSKRKQREYHAMQRQGWGSLNPTTKTVANGKAYNRKHEKSKQHWHNEHEPTCLDFLFI